VVGRVAALYRYPVKSMRGEALAEARLRWPGIDGDRRYAFVRGDNHSGFPWLSAREVPALVRFTAAFADPAQPDSSPIRVRVPDGDELVLDSEALREELARRYGGPVELLRLNRGTFDSVSVSVLSLATLRALASAGATLDPRRFRPNVVVDTDDGPPFAEDTWIGGRLCFGDRPDSAAVQLTRPIERCMMINLDPDTALQDPAVLRAVVQRHQQNAATGGHTVRPGTIRVGDAIALQAGPGAGAGA